MYDLTAAHPTLPLGSWVRVDKPAQRAGRSGANQRPRTIVPGRIIDLSYNTARVLHFESQGLQRVRLDVVRTEPRQPGDQPATWSKLHCATSLRASNPLHSIRMYDPRQNLIVALDVSSAAAAQKIVAAVGDSAFTYKVGMQLFTAEGPGVVRDLIASGRRVFLDLKYHDIPNTVASAVREAANLGVGMLTDPRWRWRQDDPRRGGRCSQRQSRLMVLGVTVLTSLDDQDLEKVGVRGRVVEQVLRLAGLALPADARE